MINRNLAKKILAFVLAALIGLSALGSLITAFADEGVQPQENYEITAVDDSYLYVEENADFALAVADSKNPITTVELADTGKIVFDGSVVPHVWVGFTTEESSAVFDLSQRLGTWFETVDFTFHDKLTANISVEIASKNPYLYRFENGKITAIDSVYTDGVHHFSTNRLGCFVSSPEKVS